MSAARELAGRVGGRARLRGRQVAGEALTGARRVRRATGLTALARDTAAVDSLEVAVAENAHLAEALTREVAALEAALVPLLEHDAAARTAQARRRTT